MTWLQEEKLVKELLQELVDISGCDFISDLHGYRDSFVISDYLLSEACSVYSLGEIERAVQYIYRTQETFISREQIVCFLETRKK